MPAWRSILFNRSTLMSPSCGFGMVSVIFPLSMYGCLPSWKGPENPSARRRTTNVRHETGPSLGITLLKLNPARHTWCFETRYWKTLSQTENEPPFKRGEEVFSALFKRFSSRPHAAKRLDFGVKTLSAVNHFVFCVREIGIDKVLNHKQYSR